MKSICPRLCGLLVLALLSTGILQAARPDALKFEVYQDAKKEYRWRLKNADDKVLATPGQGYSSKKYCEESVEKFKNNLTNAKVKMEVYPDEGKKFRWKMVVANGQTVASSPTGYATKEDCEKVIATIKKEAKSAKVEVLPDGK